MTAALRAQVRLRAAGLCEYCQLQEAESVLSFHLEHVIPKQHQGQTVLGILVLACPNCNLHKGPNLSGIDPDSGEIISLFHPRQHDWEAHFRLDRGRVVGLTPVGRTTVWVLAMNAEEQVNLRL